MNNEILKDIIKVCRKKGLTFTQFLGQGSINEELNEIPREIFENLLRQNKLYINLHELSVLREMYDPYSRLHYDFLALSRAIKLMNGDTKPFSLN
jgi:hypothetical protein